MKKIDKDADGLVTKKELKDWVNYIHTKYIWDDTGRRWTNDREQEAGGKMTWTEYLTTSYNNEPGKKQQIDRWTDGQTDRC